MSYERLRSDPQPWQEMALEEFDTMVDTDAFAKVIEDSLIEDKTKSRFDNLVVDVDSLPHEITESHYFPRRFNMSDFDASFERYRSEDGQGWQWQLTASYLVNGQQYRLISNMDHASLSTSGYEGSELEYHYGPETAVHFLAAVAAIQLEIDQTRLGNFFEKQECSNPARTISELLRLIGMRDPSATYERNRLAWLQQLEDGRALLINYGEVETGETSGRKLSYKMAWQITDATTQIDSYQTEYVGRNGTSPYFSQRGKADYTPDELLFLHRIGQDTNIGEFVDADTQPDQQAYIANSLLFVLRPHLAKYAHLDIA